MLIEKPKFVYTGSKDIFDIKWLELNIDGLKIKTNSCGYQNFIVIYDDRRSEGWYQNIFEVVKRVEKRILTKGEGRGKKFAYGSARILWRDEYDCEHEAALVSKITTRYYEPVSRFNHDKKE